MARKISRRKFLASGAAMAASTVAAGCYGPRREYVLEPYVQMPEETVAGQATWYASACRMCPAGCGIIVRVMNGRALKIEGNPEHPLNRGKLCAAGQAGLQLLYNPDRLVAPMYQAKRGAAGGMERLSWQRALDLLTEQLGGAGAGLGVWLGSTTSAHLYDLFARFAQAVGAPPPVQYDLFSALNGYQLLSSGANTLFGQAGLPTYEIGRADVVFSFGSDFLTSGPSMVRYNIEFGRFRSQGLGKRGYLVQFEPRLSNTGAKADLWVHTVPGSEGLVAAAIARLIADERVGAADRQARAGSATGAVDVAAAAAASGVPLEELVRLARIFAEAGRPLAIPGQALMGRENAAAAVDAVQSLNLIAGNVRQPGGTVLGAPPPAGVFARPPVSPYGDVRALLDRMRGGQVKVLFIHGANPAFELPQSAAFIEALNNVPFVVSFGTVLDETGAQSNLVFPERSYLESWGYETVTPNWGTPTITAQQPVVTPLHDLRSAGDVLLAAARQVQAAAARLTWNDEVSFIRETIGALPAGAFGGAGADVLLSRFFQHGGWWPAAATGAAAQPQPAAPAPAGANPPAINLRAVPMEGDANEYPFYLYLYQPPLTGAGNSAHLPWLIGSPDPLTSISHITWIEIHPDTARKLGVSKGDIVRVTTPKGELEAPVYVFPAIRPDTIGIPFGQGHEQLGRYAAGAGANPLRLVGIQGEMRGSGLATGTVRAKVTRTGRTLAVPTFESTEGVTSGFFNRPFPGD